MHAYIQRTNTCMYTLLYDGHQTKLYIICDRRNTPTGTSTHNRAMQSHRDLLKGFKFLLGRGENSTSASHGPYPSVPLHLPTDRPTLARPYCADRLTSAKYRHYVTMQSGPLEAGDVSLFVALVTTRRWWLVFEMVSFALLN